MSAGLETAPFSLTEQDKIAPQNGAVFYFGPSNKKKIKKGSSPPILRGRYQKPVPLLESGLVDLDGLSAYLHPNPHSVPLYKGPGWKYHHVNHTETSFSQKRLDAEYRDPRLVSLRNSSYQQVHMRIFSEAVFHNVHRIEVPHPASETVDMALRDFERLDMIGAATLFLNLARGNGQFGVDVDSFSKSSTSDIPLSERTAFMAEVREDHARSLVRAEVLPERLVTSSLKRLAMHLRDDNYLTGLADRRLASDPVFYPVRTPSHKTLLIKANKLLQLEFLGDEEQRAEQIAA